MWAMWAIVIFLAGSVLALRLSGRIGEYRELRPFRAQAEAASPERSRGLARENQS